MIWRYIATFTMEYHLSNQRAWYSKDDHPVLSFIKYGLNRFSNKVLMCFCSEKDKEAGDSQTEETKTIVRKPKVIQLE